MSPLCSSSPSMAVIVSNVAARVRTQALTAMGRARTTESLYAFSRKLAGVGTLDDVLWATAYQIALMLKVRVVLLLPEDGSIAVKAGYPPEDTLDEADLAAAKWAWQNNRPAGRGSDTLPGAKRLFLPMRTGRGAVGVVGIDSDKPGPLLTPDERRLLDALIDQARAGDRARPSGRGHGPRQAHRRNRAAALGPADVDLARSQDAACRDHGLGRNAARSLDAISPMPSKAELLATIIDEAERLNRFIANLLDMTRLESGAVVAEHRAARPRRDRRQRAASARQASWREHRGRGRACRRPADADARCRAVRAGAVQPARQCREICAGRNDDPHPGWRDERARSTCRSWTRATAFRPAISSTSSTSSTGRRKATRCAPAPASGSRSRAASSRPWSGTITAATAPIATGAVFTIRLPIPAQPRQLDTAA